MKSKLTARFQDDNKIELTLSKFITGPTPGTKQEFIQLLKDATILAEKKLMSVSCLAKIVINKSPDTIRQLLFLIGEKSQTWHEFVAEAEKTLMVAYPDSIINTMRSKQNPATYNICIIHGQCTHNTNECRDIKRLIALRQNKKQRFQKNQFSKSRINVIEEKAEDGQLNSSDSNEFNLVYSMSKFSAHNPFFFNAIYNGRTIKFLIDTGADISVLPASNLVETSYLQPYIGSVKSACNTSMNIIGKVANEKFTYNSIDYQFEALVCTNEMTYAILGSDFIMKNKEVLMEILQKNVNSLQVSENKTYHTRCEKLLRKYKSIFKSEIKGGELTCNKTKHHIETTSNRPIYCKQSRIPIHYEKSIEKEIEKYIQNKIIVESNSPWNSRIVPVTKKDGDVRMCIDTRPLNKITIKDRYPLPKISEILDSLNKARVFSILDCTSGYHQIRLDEESKEKTAFSFKQGHYHFERLPFGLCNGPATFQRMMDDIFRAESFLFVIPY